jgi:Carboxypeptidase regulatory-like domain/TonB-dependent Receptor Plug Domain
MTNPLDDRTGHNAQFVKRLLMVLFCTLILLPTDSILAQFLDQGAISGTVQDQSGAVIPGAQITLLSPDTGFKLTTNADRSGAFVFSPIKIGNYTMSVSAQGFENAVQKNITVSMGQRLNISPQLRLGSVSETVTVTDAPPLLQTQDISTGQTFTSQEINDTPLNGRNIVYLAQLAAGAVPSKGSRGNGNGDFDANGMRAEQNNFVLDGVDNNAVTADYLGGTSYLINPPPDALAEFKVSTSNYSAEFGHSAGAVVSASIKAGNNHVHGDVWEYFRNDFLNAHDWVTQQGTKNPEYRQNQFGATLGGPLFKDHLFLFGDVQANRIVIAVPQNPLTVPTALERQGDFSELLTPANFGASVAQTLYQPHNNQTKLACPALATATNPTGQNILCPNQIDPVAKAILNMYPLPNQSIFGIASQNYAYTLKQPQNTSQWDTRMDWDISSRDQMFARFSYLNQLGNNQAPLGPILDGGGGNGSLNVSGSQVNYGNNFVLSETHIFTPRLVNELRFAFDFGHFDILNPGYNTNNAAALGLGGVPSGPDFPDNGGLPTTTISGGGGIAGFGAHAFRPEEEFEDEYQILDNFSWDIGKHSVRLGFSYQSVRSATLEPPTSHPAYTFSGAQTSKPSTANTGSGIADFLTNNMSGGSIGPSGKFNNAQDNIAAYVQDDWKLTKNLTLNLGVRYEHFQPYKEMAGRMANFYSTSTGISTGTGVYAIPAQNEGKLSINPAFLALLAKDHITLVYDPNERLTEEQKLNFAPRVGFAYTANNKSVIRGGFGTFYQGQQQGGAAVDLATNYPFVFSDNFPAPSCPAGSANCANNGYNLETGFSNAITQGLSTYFATPGLVGQSPNLKTTYAMDYNLALEQALTNNFVETISYVGTVGRHLPISINTNSTTVLLPSGTTQAFLPFPDFTGSSDVLYEGISTYNALQTKLEKRVSHGLNFSANYTWSHSLDDAANPLGGGIGGYRDASIIPIREDMTNSGWDTRHRFTFNGFYRLPFGRGQSHLNHDSLLVDSLLGGWSTNLTYQLQSGNPFSVGTANQTNVTGGSQYAIMRGNPFAPGGTPDPTNPSISCPTSVRNKAHWYNPCAFANPLPASLLTPFNKNNGNPTVAAPGFAYPSYITDPATAKLFLGGRSNQVYGPGLQRLDMSVFKHFHTFEAEYLEFRADCFNVLNTPIYAIPSSTSIGQSGGQITGARSLQNDTPNSRFFQLSAKYVF